MPTFPSSPVLNQVFGRWQWDGQGWRARSLPLGSAALRDVGALAGNVLDAAHALTTAAHGVTRTLLTFSAATPGLISGNLLTLDEQRGVSGWSSLAGNTVAMGVAGGADGGGKVTSTFSGTGSFHQLFVSSRKAVVAGTSYTASARIEHSRTIGQAWVLLDWYDAGNVYLSSSVGAAVTPGTGTATAFVTGAAPAGAVTVQPIVRCFVSAAAADVLSVSVACLRTSATIPGSSGVAGATPNGAACLTVEAFNGVNCIKVTRAGIAAGEGVSYIAPSAGAAGVGRFLVHINTAHVGGGELHDFRAYAGSKTYGLRETPVGFEWIHTRSVGGAAVLPVTPSISVGSAATAAAGSVVYVLPFGIETFS